MVSLVAEFNFRNPRTCRDTYGVAVPSNQFVTTRTLCVLTFTGERKQRYWFEFGCSIILMRMMMMMMMLSCFSESKTGGPFAVGHHVVLSDPLDCNPLHDLENRCPTVSEWNTAVQSIMVVW